MRAAVVPALRAVRHDAHLHVVRDVRALIHQSKKIKCNIISTAVWSGSEARIFYGKKGRLWLKTLCVTPVEGENYI